VRGSSCADTQCAEGNDQLPGSFREFFNLALQPFAKLMKTVEVELYFTIVYSRLPETVHSWNEWIGLK
jgi:hypothetical protein